MPPFVQSHEDEGFEALFKPIQDLTRNWDVDLSLHIEEYITYIRQICGDNIPDMNFAQAAVLVQNSANIYGKKVDLLFSTVLQLVDSIGKKQKDRKGKDGLDENEGAEHSAGRRRKPVSLLETEEFVMFDEVCSDRCLTINVAKEKQKNLERKKKNIVLNAATKVKAKEKTSCNVYNHANEVMGKKEEFRLNWRICSAGTLHEEFVVNKHKFNVMEPIEITVLEHDNAPDDNSHHDYDNDYSHHNGDLEHEEPPPLPTSLFSVNFADNENFKEEGEKRTEQARARTDNIIDAKETEYIPNGFEVAFPEKPMKKKKVIKVPLSLEDENKRKRCNDDLEFSTFTISDIIIEHFKGTNFLRDRDYVYLSKFLLKEKRALLAKIRSGIEGMNLMEEGTEQNDDNPGFDYDDEDPGFDGFNNASDAGDDEAVDAPELNVPLPDNILDPQANENWRGDDGNTYDNEARKTIQAFRSRKIDHGRMTDLTKRVEEWHRKILPKLEAAEQRSSFDIHEYGTRVLESFPDGIGSQKTFQEVVNGQPREEVARYFLASLMLANQYNVEISETEPGDLNVDCVQLKLLSTVRHHEELDDNMRQTSDK